MNRLKEKSAYNERLHGQGHSCSTEVPCNNLFISIKLNSFRKGVIKTDFWIACWPVLSLGNGAWKDVRQQGLKIIIIIIIIMMM